MLSRLDKEQESIKQSVEIGMQALETVLNLIELKNVNKFIDYFFKLKQNFESNLDSIKINFEHLNERIVKIGGKSPKT